MLFLVTGRMKSSGTAGSPSPADLVRAGLGTLETLVAMEHRGVVRGGGIAAGGSAIAFILEVTSGDEAHDTIVRLPSYAQADWTVTPLVSFERDLAVTREAAHRLGIADRETTK